MQKVRWGIISTAKIGVEKVIPAMQQGQYSEVVAIASRSSGKAEEAAQKLDIETAVGSYQQLLELPDVDAIYNPLPNHLHVDWSIKALKAGKHVLCEKPLGLNHADASRLKEAADKYADLKVMEAFMYRHHPRWQKVKELVDNGDLGDLQTVHASFSYFNDDPGDIRNKPDIGGGSLMDIGCYCISIPRFIFGSEPEAVSGKMEIDPELGIDRLTSGMLQFADGTATFTSGTQMAPHQKVTIWGTKGKIEVPMPFNAPADRPTKLFLTQGSKTEEIRFESCNQYTAQGDRLSKAILKDAPVPTPLEDALANMTVVDAIVESSNEEVWVEC
jgi:predicted dehydrogenase